MEEAMRFVFTTKALLDIASVALFSEAAQSKIAVINSGFGFPGAERRVHVRDRKPAIAYLGTVDFVKMHPGFFDALDRLTGGDIRVSVWGAIDPSGSVAARARAMRHPERVTFRSVRPEDDRAYGVHVVRAGTQDAFVDLENVGGAISVHAAEGVRSIVLEAGALGVTRGATVTWNAVHPVELRWDP